jgi:flavin reductase (DIM6/NTAB) family NADH-FMN oxidoreductase RutF
MCGEPALAGHAEKLAPLTDNNHVPEIKAKQFQFENDKFGAATLTAISGEVIKPARVAECAIQMEAAHHCSSHMKGRRLREVGRGVAVEIGFGQVHVAEQFIKGESYIDPGEWSPLL